MHATRTALWVLAASAAASMALGALDVQDLGVVRLAVPTPLVMVIPVAIGTGIGLASSYEVDRRVAAVALGSRWSRWRMRGAELFWVNGWLVVGALTGWLGLWLRPTLPLSAVICNVLLFGALATAVVALRRADLAWAPGTTLLVLAVLFGATSPGSTITYYWWAQFLLPDVSPWRIAISAGTWVVASTVLALRSPAASR